MSRLARIFKQVAIKLPKGIWRGVLIIVGLCFFLSSTTPGLAQQQYWKGRRTAPRFSRSRNLNPSTYQVHQNRLRQIDRFGAVKEQQIRELQIGPGGQYSATVVNPVGQPSTIPLPKDTTLGVQPLDSNQITVTDALKREQTVQVDRITYDALGNTKVIYKDSRGVEHQAPLEGHQSLKPGLQELYSKSVDIQDELGQVKTVRLQRLFRDTNGALKAQVVGPEGIPATVDAKRIVGTIPETSIPAAPPPPLEKPPGEEPTSGALPQLPYNQPSAIPGPEKLTPPPPEQ